MKLTRHTSKISPVLFLFLLISTTLVGSFFHPDKAKAADIDDLPQYLNSTYDQYLSRNPDINGKGNYTPSFRFILYSPTSGSSSQVRVTRGGVIPNQTAPPRCDDFVFDHAELTLDNSQTGQISRGSYGGLGCSDRSYGFLLSGISEYHTSQRFGGYSGTVIRLTLRTNPDGASTFADIEVVGGSDRLSYVGDNTSSIPDSANGVSMSLPENSGNTIATKFAPPCNSNVSNAYVWWKDADSGEETNGGNKVYVELREFKNGYSNGYKTLVRKNAGSGGGHDNIPFTPRAGAKYEVRFSPVRSRSASHAANTIKVWVPFDSAAAYVKCPDPPPPSPCQENWSYNVSDHSVYKFTIFDRQPSVTNPSPVDKSSGASREWASTSGAVNLKTEYHNSNDGNYSTNLPNEAQYLGGYVLIERWHDYDSNNNGSRDRMEYGRTHAVIPKCATAACTAIRITNALEGTTNGVPAGGPVQVEVDITGTNLPGYLASQPLAVIVDSADWGGGVFSIVHGIGSINFPDTTDTKNFELTMPFDFTPRNLSVYIGYPGLYAGKVSASCGAPVNPYQEFHVTPIAQTPDMDDEDPRVINYTTGGNNSGASVSLNWDRQLLRKRGGAESTLDGVYSTANTFGNHTENHSIGAAGVPLVPGTLQAGDQVCSRASFGITDGWVGPGNHIPPELASAKSPPANPAESCVTISDRPYLRLYGSDILAGSDFAVGGACNKTNSSQIKTFFSKNTDRSGSGGQFAALALGAIDQFSSASLRTALPTPRNGLSFANNGTTPGSYDGAAICSSDFFGETQYDDPAKKDTRQGATLPLNSINHSSNNDKQTLADPNNPQNRVTIHGTTGFGIRHTVFVDGDLNIDSDIEYSAFTNPSDAPALAVIVRGNIYIEKGVSRLDGMYVAQKKADGSGGTIYTCSDGFTPYNTSDDAALLANCSSQLTINGAFVADYVRFLRTINSLRDSLVNDQELAGITKAAEIFNFTPELYISPPPFNNENTSSSGKYKYFDTLPPIL